MNTTLILTTIIVFVSLAILMIVAQTAKWFRCPKNYLTIHVQTEQSFPQALVYEQKIAYCHKDEVYCATLGSRMSVFEVDRQFYLVRHTKWAVEQLPYDFYVNGLEDDHHYYNFMDLPFATLKEALQALKGYTTPLAHMSKERDEQFIINCHQIVSFVGHLIKRGKRTLAHS